MTEGTNASGGSAGPPDGSAGDGGICARVRVRENKVLARMRQAAQQWESRGNDMQVIARQVGGDRHEIIGARMVGNDQQRTLLWHVIQAVQQNILHERSHKLAHRLTKTVPGDGGVEARVDGVENGLRCAHGSEASPW